MTHDELLAKMDFSTEKELPPVKLYSALRAVVELHKPDENGYCIGCDDRCGCYEGDMTNKNTWITCPTIKAIEKELG